MSAQCADLTHFQFLSFWSELFDSLELWFTSSWFPSISIQGESGLLKVSHRKEFVVVIKHSTPHPRVIGYCNEKPYFIIKKRWSTKSIDWAHFMSVDIKLGQTEYNTMQAIDCSHILCSISTVTTKHLSVHMWQVLLNLHKKITEINDYHLH